MDSDSDEDIKRAIALSLETVSQESPTPLQSTVSISKGLKNVDGEELTAALALSLEGVPRKAPQRSKPHTPVVGLTSDDEDDDLDAPVAVYAPSAKCLTQKVSSDLDQSLPNKTKTTGYVIGKNDSIPLLGDQNSVLKLSSPTVQPDAIIPTVSKGSGLFGLGRKQMEEERLARTRQKRKREEGLGVGPNESRRRKPSESFVSSNQEHHQVKPELSERRDPLDRVVSNDGSRQPKSSTKQLWDSTEVTNLEEQNGTDEPPFPNSRSRNTKTEIAVATNKPLEEKSRGSYQEQHSLRANGVQYLDGIVRRTWAYGFPRQSDDIKFEEVIQKADLELAVMSAFQIDPDWVISKLDPKTKVVWVLQAKTEAEKENFRSHAPPNYRFCFPRMDGNMNCMHSKLLLLAHPTHLRVVVPSANLVPYDWGETGLMENTCFLIDLPRLSEGSKLELTHFGKELLHFVEAMGLDQTIIKSMTKFDFARTVRLGFVHSIGGSHAGGDQWKRTGYCGLGTTVQRLGLKTEETVHVDFVASSVGSLNDSFIKSMYLAAQGNDGLTEYGWRVNKSTKGKPVSQAEKKILEEIELRFRVYFPARETVAQSRGGIRSAGTICFQPKWYDADDFPRSLMRDCKSQREGMLMHNKMMFVRHHNKASGGDIGWQGWAYIGSANLSESAWFLSVRYHKAVDYWGRLVKDKITKEPKLNCRNWECGVLFPVVTTPRLLTQLPKPGDPALSSPGPPGMEIFKGHIPVPMVLPALEYGARRPWFYSEQ